MRRLDVKNQYKYSFNRRELIFNSLFICIISILNIYNLESKLNFIDKVNEFKIDAVYQWSIYNENIYFLNNKGFYRFKPFTDTIVQLYKTELDKYSHINYYQFDMLDTSLMYFTYFNGILVKDKGNWLNFDTNSVLPSTSIDQVILNRNNEFAIITPTNKIVFYENSKLSVMDCEMNFDCMPMPFVSKVGFYYNNCLYYINSNSNLNKSCDLELSKTYPREFFSISNPDYFRFNHYTEIDGKVWMCNIWTNLLYIFDGENIIISRILSDSVEKANRFDPNRALILYDLKLSNDNFLYVMYKEIGINGYPSGASKTKLFKMTIDFELITEIPLPNIEQISPMISGIEIDIKDKNNVKIYLPTPVGFYIYDPDPTSVEISTENNIDGLFISEIYPNPASGIVRIKYGADISNSNKVRMFVTNIMGERVKELNKMNTYDKSTGYGNAKLDISDLVSGNYLLVVTDGYNYATKNILIIK